VLLGAAALLLTAGAGGCGLLGSTTPPAPPQPDALLPLAAAARADAALARSLATLVPQQAGAMQTVSAERSAHADALVVEIVRAAGPPSPPPSPSPTPAPGPPQPTLGDLRTSLQRNQAAAAELARTSPAYRAGLLGSVAAACAAEVAVLL